MRQTEYPNWETKTEKCGVYHDGKLKFKGTNNECFAWILRNNSSSVSHALKYEGYAVKDIET